MVNPKLGALANAAPNFGYLLAHEPLLVDLINKLNWSRTGAEAPPGRVDRRYSLRHAREPRTGR